MQSQWSGARDKYAARDILRQFRGTALLTQQPAAAHAQTKRGENSQRDEATVKHYRQDALLSAVVPQFAVFSSSASAAPQRMSRRSRAGLVLRSFNPDRQQLQVLEPIAPIVDTGGEPFVAQSHGKSGALEVRPVGQSVIFSAVRPPLNRAEYGARPGDAGFCDKVSFVFSAAEWEAHAPFLIREMADALTRLQRAASGNAGTPDVVFWPDTATSSGVDMAEDTTTCASLDFLAAYKLGTPDILASEAGMAEDDPIQRLAYLYEKMPHPVRAQVSVVSGWQILWPDVNIQIMGAPKQTGFGINQLRPILSDPKDVAELRQASTAPNLGFSDLLALCRKHLSQLLLLPEAGVKVAEKIVTNKPIVSSETSDFASAIRLVDASIVAVANTESTLNGRIREAVGRLAHTAMDQFGLFDRNIWEALANSPHFTRVMVEQFVFAETHEKRALIANMSHLARHDSLSDLMPVIAPFAQSIAARELCNWEESLATEARKESYARYVRERLPGHADDILRNANLETTAQGAPA